LKKSRNSSLELLRILLMLGVVVLHYNNGNIGGGFRYVVEGSVNQYYLFLSESISIHAVNTFVLISAYFLSVVDKRSVFKVIELLIQVSVFREIFYIVENIGHISIGGIIYNIIPLNYFVILYSVIYLLSPYINKLCNSLSKKQMKKLLIMSLCFFSVWTILIDYIGDLIENDFTQLSTIGAFGSQAGYTIVNFFVIYIIGYYIRHYIGVISPGKSLTGIAVCVSLLFVLSIAEHILLLPSIVTWNYNNPIIIGLSIFCLLFFGNFSWSSCAVNELAQAAFTCFLIHTYFLKFFEINNFVNGNLGVLILHQIGVAIVLYLLSYAIYKVYSLLSRMTLIPIKRLCEKLDERLY